MATRGVAALADLADLLAGPHAVALGHIGLVLEVHVDVVAAGLLAVDDDVVARRAVEARVLHLAAAGRLQGRAAVGEHVLALVGVAGARCAHPVAVGVLAAHRELVVVVAERRAAVAQSVAESADPERVLAALRALAVVADPVPREQLLGVRRHVLQDPATGDALIALIREIDAHVGWAVAVEHVAEGGLALPVEERLRWIDRGTGEPEASGRGELVFGDALEPEGGFRHLTELVDRPRLAVARLLRELGLELSPADLGRGHGGTALAGGELDLLHVAEAPTRELDRGPGHGVAKPRAAIEAAHIGEPRWLRCDDPAGPRPAAPGRRRAAAGQRNPRRGECDCDYDSAPATPGPRLRGQASPSLSQAYGVSCRARAERAALQTLPGPIRPRDSGPFGSPAPPRLGHEGFGRSIWRRQYIGQRGGVHIRTKQNPNTLRTDYRTQTLRARALDSAHGTLDYHRRSAPHAR